MGKQNYLSSQDSAEANSLQTKAGIRLLKSTIEAVLGSIFFAIMSQLEIALPWTPIPITLQTLAVFLLALTQGKLAVFSILLYIAQATIGLPVLAGGYSNPIWFLGPKAGYLIGFVISAYLIAVIQPQNKPFTFGRSALALIVGQVAISTIAAIWLAFFVGAFKAVILGVVPFLPGACVKIIIALGLIRPIQHGKKWLAKLGW